MDIDPLKAQFARQNLDAAKARKKAAFQRFEDETLRGRESAEKFYTTLALFSGGTIALSVTYLGYLNSSLNKNILYPKALIAAWIVLIVCVVASLFWIILNSFYSYFARLGIYADNLIEEKETLVEEIDNLLVVNATSEDMEEQKNRFTQQAIEKGKDRRWAKTRESVCRRLSVGCACVAALAFPIGLGLLAFFAVQNM